MPIPPVVEPGPALTAEQRRRYDRHLLLPGIGPDGQRRLRNARVCVVGAGGLGSPVLLYLAAAGVGTLGIVDQDDVDETNLQRQVVHGRGDVGRPKVDSAREAVLALDPDVAVVVHRGTLTEQDVEDVLSGYDVVVDASDNFPTRYLVNDACVALGLPEVWGSVLRFDAQVSVFWGRPTAPGVAAVQLRDLFPEPPAADEVPSCAEAGVLGALCGQAGSVMATEVVKLVTGAGEPLLGRVLVIDALASRWTEVTFAQAAGSTREVGPAPARASSTVTARELAALLAGPPAGRPFVVDVREPTEHAIVAIPGSRLVPLGQILDGSAFEAFPRDRQIVLHCRTGARSAQALRAVLEAGFTDVAHLDGGILAWVDDVDPTLTRY
ncbi:ThiF family adenylyltransferase [Cellulomonas sp. P24]|uniref:ThiF family adenylyltransferase n=1 Tax=Cellulomonas sp. P24 TaxID=2885206 RepID=UPI00216B62D3|nr:ThiF family adenylyltransferase [Cellulomonas sp. P24]MCR6491816.1 ThiF family adenylyltransferase [Cellulomonas sp. P24]